MDKTAYLFDETTKEYLEETTAQESPLEPGVWLLPANSTFTAPPSEQSGYARVWGGESWSQVEDHRGVTVWKDYDTSMVIKDLGPIPEGWSETRPAKPVTKEDLSQFLFVEKSKVAYGGVTIIKDAAEYLFETGQDSITMCNSQAIAFSVMEEGATVDWKVYQDDFPVLLTLTKAQFLQIFAFGMQMINYAFAVEGDFNIEVKDMTEEELHDEDHIANFKARAESSFGQIPRRFEITAATNQNEEV